MYYTCDYSVLQAFAKETLQWILLCFRRFWRWSITLRNTQFYTFLAMVYYIQDYSVSVNCPSPGSPLVNYTLDRFRQHIQFAKRCVNF